MLPLTGCPGPAPIEPESGTSGEMESSSSAPTEASDTQLMTTDNMTGTTVMPTSDATTTTGEPASTSDTGESTGGGAIVVEGLAHPESILHDKVADVYLISNINGEPDGDDDDGFISRVHPDGTIEELRWIDGADAEVELDAPKGMAIVGDVLYVADLTEVRKFDRVSGAQIGSIPIAGALFLNDLAASPIGRVYVSDTGANSLHFIDGDAVTTMLTSPELSGPNGLLFAGDFLTVVGFDGPNMFNVPFEGPNASVVYTFAFGMLDGIVAVPDGILVSSWDEAGAGVYKLATDLSGVTPIVEGIDSPADIEVDLDRNMLLVPVLLQDRAEFYPL